MLDAEYRYNPALADLSEKIPAIRSVSIAAKANANAPTGISGEYLMDAKSVPISIHVLTAILMYATTLKLIEGFPLLINYSAGRFYSHKIFCQWILVDRSSDVMTELVM